MAQTLATLLTSARSLEVFVSPAITCDVNLKSC
jgi:hypothetical protein